MNQDYSSTLPSVPSTQDPDIQKLKHLFQQLLHKSSQPSDWPHKQTQYKYKIAQMEYKILELAGRLAELQNERFEIQKQLQFQKEQRNKERHQFQHKMKQAEEIIKDRDFWLTPDKDVRTTEIKRIQTVQPSSRNKSPIISNVKRTETLIDELIELQQSKVSADQIHRLNSYLVQNTTSLNLLTERCNYLIKLREMDYPNLSEQAQLMQKTKELVSDRKVAEQAKTVLYKSRKVYFQSDYSSSDIQLECNDLAQKQL